MSETANATTQNQGTPGIIASAGPATAGTPPFLKRSAGDTNEPPADDKNSGGNTENQNAGAGAAGDGGAAAGANAAAGQAGANQNQLPEIDNAQLEEILKSRGITLPNGLEGLKNQTPANTPEPTAEEKAAQEAAMEKRMLDHFIKHGGTAEEYVQLKQVASMDLKDLSEVQIRQELKAEGFSEADVNAILVERYFQINPDELKQGDEESDEEFTARKELVKKKVAYGSKKFQSSYSHIQQGAKNGLQQLRDAIKVEEQIAQQEVELASTVDAVAKELPRKLSFPLGKVNDQEVAPIEFEVSDAHVAAVVDTLKDPVKRNQLLFNQENSLNVQSLANLILRNQILEDALRASYLDGGSREVAKLEKVFPGRTAQSVGLGGGSTQQPGRKGHIVSAGEPVPASHPSNRK